MKPAHRWMTIAQAAAMLDWTGRAGRVRMLRAIRRAEASGGRQVLHNRGTKAHPRYRLTLAGLRRAVPELFARGADHLPMAIQEEFEDVRETIQQKIFRDGVQRKAIADLRRHNAELEGRIAQLEMIVVSRAQNRSGARLATASKA